MKKLNAFLWVSVVLLTLMVTACSKSESAGAGSSPTPVPIPPKITVNQPVVGWYGDTIFVSYSLSGGEAGDQVTVKVNGNITTQNPHIVPNVTTPVSLSFTATGKGGTSTPQPVIARSYAYDTTTYVRTFPNTQGKWFWKSGTINGNPEAPVTEVVKFFVDGTSISYPPGLPPTPPRSWSQIGDSILVNGLKWHYAIQNDTIIIRSRVNQGQLVVETIAKR